MLTKEYLRDIKRLIKKDKPIFFIIEFSVGNYTIFVRKNVLKTIIPDIGCYLNNVLLEKNCGEPSKLFKGYRFVCPGFFEIFDGEPISLQTAYIFVARKLTEAICKSNNKFNIVYDINEV